MKEITFTYDGNQFTLDLEHGILHGANIEVVNMIEKHISSYLWHGSVGGGIAPFKAVEITDPYRDIYQFTACITDCLHLHPFPPELEPYMPEFHKPFDIEKELLRFPEEERDRIREAWEESPDYY